MPAPEPALRALVAELPIKAAAVDADLRYVAATATWRRALGLDETHAIAGRVYDSQDGMLPAPELLRRFLAGAAVGPERIRRRPADSEPEVASWLLSPWHADDGSVGGVLVYADVVSERVEVETRLADREGLIGSLFRQSPIGMNLCRMDGLWLESNPAFLEIIGYSNEEADGGLTYWQLTPPEYEEAEQVQLASLAETGRYGPYEKEFIRKDGTRVPVRLNGFIIERDGEQYIWSLIEDITERKKLERRVAVERLKAIQASKLAMLGETAAGFAHEVNNPLAIIDAYAFKLRDLIARGEEERVDQAIQHIRDAVTRAAKIVTGLRRFARESDDDDVERIPISFLLNETLDLCRERLRNHGVELRTRLDTDHSVRCGRVAFGQVILNLINNAFDAVKAVQGDKWIAIEVGESERDGFLDVTITDSGAGIPRPIVDKLFQPFFTTKAIGEGTGLGLSISKGIMESLGGDLLYEEDADHTTFVAQIPAVEDSPCP